MNVAKLAAIGLMLLLNVFANAQTGTIKGKITDGQTGETLIGASALIKGTTTGAIANLDGYYEIKGLSYGEYTLVVTFVSYNTKVITGIVVNAQKPIAVVDVVLETAGIEIKTAEVTAVANRQSNVKLLSTIKNLATVSDGISAETIKRTPDKNTGEILKRVSGTSVQGNKFVVVRGLSDRYNGAMINGMPLPSFEPDRKSVSFDVFPASLIDNLIISKTATPELPGEFTGGLVQINTREVPEDPFVSATIGTGINTISTFKNYSHYGYGDKDWLAYDDGTREFPNGLPAPKYMLGASRQQLLEYSKKFDNDFPIYNENSAPLRNIFQFAAAGKTNVGKTTLGVIASAVYDQQYKTTQYDRRDYLIDTTTLFRYIDDAYSRQVLTGGILNFSLNIDEKNKVSLRNFISRNSEQLTTLRNGWSADLQKNIQATSDQYTSTQVSLHQLQGEHLLPVKNLKLDWGFSYSNTYRNIPNLRKMFYTRDYNDDTSAWVAFIPSGSPSPNYGGRFYSNLNENTFNEKLDITIPLDFLKGKHTAKAGFLLQQRDRVFDARVLGYSIAYTSQFNYDLLYYGQDSIFDKKNISEEGFLINEITNGSDHYNGDINLNSFYIQFDNNLLDNKLLVIWGIRNESFHQQLRSKDYGGNDLTIDRTENDLLPSANFVYAVNKEMNVRFSASKTVARPEFRELAPFSFYDFTLLASVQGNDSLVRSKQYNYDLRWELYPGFNQLISASVFYKKFVDPIEQVFYSSGNRQYTYDNVKAAENFGLEFDVRYSFSSFLKDPEAGSKILRNLGLLANAALIKSTVDLSEVATAFEDERPLQGQSPYILNLGLQYYDRDEGLSMSLLFNRIGRRISLVGTFGFPDIYEAPRSLFDFQIAYNIFKKKNGELKLNYSDIFNAQILFYQDEDKNKKYNESSDKLIQSNKPGSNISLSLTVKF